MGKVESMRERALQSRDAIELLSDKWRVAVLHVLTPGPLRANQLQSAIDLVSPKMLTQTLRGSGTRWAGYSPCSQYGTCPR